MTQNLKDEFLKQLDFNGIKVEISPLYNKIVPGCMHTLPVLISVKTGRMITKRLPINICFVLDISGSMDGDKLKNCKTAIIKILDQLIPEDTVHLVVYNDRSSILFENETIEHKAGMISMIKSMNAAGGTNLYDGLCAGAKVLKGVSHKCNALHLFLFSDGCITMGENNERTIFSTVAKYHVDDNIYCTTYGIGEDFKETLMSGIAKHGESHFFYIDNNDRIPILVNKGLMSIANMVSRNAHIKLIGRGGMQLVKMFGNKLVEGTDLHKGYRIGIIREYSIINILAEFTMVPAHEYVVESYLELNALIGETDKYVHTHQLIDVATTEEWLTDSLNENNVVKMHCVVQECNKLDAEAAIHILSGNRQRAIELKQQVLDKLIVIKDFDEMKITEAKYQLVSKELSELLSMGINQHTVKSAAAASKQYEAESDEDLGFGLFD